MKVPTVSDGSGWLCQDSLVRDGSSDDVGDAFPRPSLASVHGIGINSLVAFGAGQHRQDIVAAVLVAANDRRLISIAIISVTPIHDG